MRTPPGPCQTRQRIQLRSAAACSGQEDGTIRFIHGPFHLMSPAITTPHALRIRKSRQYILAHLGLPTGAPSFRAPPDRRDGLPTDPPREWSYEPRLDDLPVPDPVIV
jgi:hypothetical protein